MLFFCDMEGHFFAEKSKPSFKDFEKKELQSFRFVVGKKRLKFVGERNPIFGRKWRITENFRGKGIVASTGDSKIKIDDEGTFILSVIREGTIRVITAYCLGIDTDDAFEQYLKENRPDIFQMLKEAKAEHWREIFDKWEEDNMKK